MQVASSYAYRSCGNLSAFLIRRRTMLERKVLVSFHRTGNAIVIEGVKGDDHFLLIYPDTPAGRLAAKQAVRVWLLDCELDFDRRDAEQLWRAIDVRRFGGRLDRCGERGREAGHEKQETMHGRASGPALRIRGESRNRSKENGS
jgi:hypothetical protein